MQDKISVIVPIYNVEKCVDKCIESILCQTYTNLEIILVDDGSTDCSGELCDKWAEKDERVIVLHKDNEGLSDARNDGLKIATGRYVGFVDGDDWIADNMYEYLYQLMKEYDSDISICEHYLESEQGDLSAGGLFGPNVEKYERKEALWELVQDEVVHSYVWDKLFKKELFDGIVFPKGRYVQDMYTIYKVFMRANFVVSGHEPQYYYFIRSNSIQQSRGEKLDWDQFCVYKDWYENLSIIFPEWERYLLNKWISFTVSAYNSMLLRTEKGKDTLERKQEMLNTINTFYHEINFSDNRALKLRLMLIRCIGYTRIYPIIKKVIVRLKL